MAVLETDLILIERDGTLYKATADDLAALATGGGTEIHVGTTPPASPAVGDLWVDTN